MKTINAKNKNLKEVFAEALKINEETTIECSDGLFVYHHGFLTKVIGQKVFLYNHISKQWEDLTQ